MRNLVRRLVVAGKQMDGRCGVLLSIAFWLMSGCTPQPEEKHTHRAKEDSGIERLAGEVNVTPTVAVLERGRVLLSYSDCFSCHKESDQKRGPAFTKIAARYPMNSTYIDVLAQRVILGSKGAWGNTVMPPHPKVSADDAETMVSYILSLE